MHAEDRGAPQPRNRRPPTLGTLLDVFPIAQTQHRDTWSLTLVSIERWDTCLVATCDIHYAGGSALKHRDYPKLEVELSDGRATPFETWFGGGYGGDLRNGGRIARQMIKITPSIEAVTRLHISGRLQVHHSPGEPMSRPTIVWEDPQPWLFLAQSRQALPDTRERDRSSVPTSVIPVVQSWKVAGWTITCIALERFSDGFRVGFRVLGTSNLSGIPELMLEITDDCGNRYQTWSGGGNGEPSDGACHWRISYQGAPLIASPARFLRIDVVEARVMTFELDEHDPTRGTEVVGEAVSINGSFVVDLQ